MMRSLRPAVHLCRPAVLGWAALLLLGCAKAPETPPSSTPSVVQSQLGSYVYPAWREAQDFKRISEYFTGRENQGGNLILRTDEAERSGMYFHVGLPLGMRFEDGTTAVLEYIHSDAPDVETRTFVLPEMPPGIFAELLLGLTGKDWPKSTRKAKSHHTRSLVAWRITLKDSAGVILVLRQSFLWAMEPT